MKKITFIFLLMAIISISCLTLALTVDSIVFHDDIEDSAYDITGVINGGTEISTTYRNNGYEVFFNVDDCSESDELFIENYTNGETLTKDGVDLSITGTVLEGNKSVEVLYKVKNVSDVEKKYALATTADTDLAKNDCAAIYKSSTSIIQITQDNNGSDPEDSYADDYVNSYGTQIKISLLPAAETTWIGNYGDRFDNRYTNGTVTSYTFDDTEDTGLAFSWNGTLAAGEEKTYKAIFGIDEAEIGRANFYKMGESTPFTSVQGLIGGSIITPASPTELELGYKCFWNTKPDGTGVEYEAEKGMILSSDGMNLYEFNKSVWHEFNIFPSTGLTIDDEIMIEDEELYVVLFLLETKDMLTYETNYENHCYDYYNKDGKLLFSIDYWNDILTLAEGVTAADSIEYELTDEDKEFLAEDFDIFIEKISLMFRGKNEPVAYKILEGADQEHKEGEDLVVKTNGDISKLTEIKVDGVKVDEANYTIKSGSTIATLKSTYLDTLSEGNHTLTFVYDDGEVSTSFKIAKANIEPTEIPNDDGKEDEKEIENEIEEPETDNPKTGDRGISLWITLIIISSIGIATTIIKSKKK